MKFKSERSREVVLILALLSGLAGAVQADERTEQEAKKSEQQAASVRDWLALQRRGDQAGTQPRLEGEELQRIYERYLESFTHAIPRRFRMDD